MMGERTWKMTGYWTFFASAGRARLSFARSSPVRLTFSTSEGRYARHQTGSLTPLMNRATHVCPAAFV